MFKGRCWRFYQNIGTFQPASWGILIKTCAIVPQSDTRWTEGEGEGGERKERKGRKVKEERYRQGEKDKTGKNCLNLEI